MAKRNAFNKSRFLSFGHWYNKLGSEWPKLRPEFRARICLEMMKLIGGKLKDIPSSASDSVENATELLNIVKALENNTDLNASTELKSPRQGSELPSEPGPVVQNFAQTSGEDTPGVGPKTP